MNEREKTVIEACQSIATNQKKKKVIYLFRLDYCCVQLRLQHEGIKYPLSQIQLHGPVNCCLVHRKSLSRNLVGFLSPC